MMKLKKCILFRTKGLTDGIMGIPFLGRSWDANRQQHFIPPGGLPEQWDIRGMEKWDICGI